MVWHDLGREEEGTLVRLQNIPIPSLTRTLFITLNLTLLAGATVMSFLYVLSIVLSACLVYYVLSMLRVSFQKKSQY